jgi:hypothetical protein
VQTLRWVPFLVVLVGGSPSLSPAAPAPTFRVTAVTPAPGAVVTVAPAEIVVTLSDTVEAATLGSATVKLVRDGPDDAFDTGDDVVITPAAITVTGGNQIHLDLTGVPLANDTYRLTLVANTPINSGRVAWWRMDESSGSTVKDSSGKGNHGTIGGNPTWVPGGGRVGGALSFDGSGDFVFVPQNATLEPLGSMSVTMWAKMSNIGGGFTDLLRKADSDMPGYLVRWYHFDDHLWWRLDRKANPPIYAEDTQITTPYLGAWHHIAGIYDGVTGTTSLYVDGALKTSASGFAGPLEHTDDLFLMWSDHPGQVAAQGLLDDVRIYSRALTVPEITSLAAAVSDEAVTDLNGSPLDGNFSGSFPSGDGAPGGHFVSTFDLNTNAPVAPSLLIATPTPTGQIDLAWTDNSSNELGFKIERSVDGTIFAEIASVGAGVATTQDPLPPGPCYYRVRAFNAAGNSSYSNPASATPAPAATTSITLKGCGLAGAEVLALLAFAALFRRRRAGTSGTMRG